MKGKGGDKQVALRIPNHGSSGGARVWNAEWLGLLHHLVAIVCPGYIPGETCIAGVIQARRDVVIDGGGLDDVAFERGGDRGYHGRRRGCAPRQPRCGYADKAVTADDSLIMGHRDHGPCQAAVRGTHDTFAVVGVGCVIRIAGSYEDHARSGRLDGNGTDREGGYTRIYGICLKSRKVVGKGRKADVG